MHNFGSFKNTERAISLLHSSQLAQVNESTSAPQQFLDLKILNAIINYLVQDLVHMGKDIIRGGK